MGKFSAVNHSGWEVGSRENSCYSKCWEWDAEFGDTVIIEQGE